MFQEWTQSATVHAGGKIEVTLPELAAGAKVEVTVRTIDSPSEAESPEVRAQRIQRALANLKSREVEGAHITADDLKRENLYPDRI